MKSMLARLSGGGCGSAWARGGPGSAWCIGRNRLYDVDHHRDAQLFFVDHSWKRGPDRRGLSEYRLRDNRLRCWKLPRALSETTAAGPDSVAAAKLLVGSHGG